MEDVKCLGLEEGVDLKRVVLGSWKLPASAHMLAKLANSIWRWA